MKSKQEFVDMFRVLAKWGYTDSVYTHCSYMPDDETIMINDFRSEFSEMSEDNILEIKLGGDMPEGINPAAFAVHQAVHQARPDMRCVIHTHSLDGVAFSSTGQDLRMNNQIACRFYDRVGRLPYKGLAVDPQHIADPTSVLARKNIAVILENHGLLVGGPTIASAMNDTYLLERACSLELRILSSGKSLNIDSELAAATRDQFESGTEAGEREWKAVRETL